MDHSDIRKWLQWFADVVRNRDTEAGKTRFHDHCLAFGTREIQMRGKNALAEEQWTPVWQITHNFDFDYSTLEVLRNENLAVAAVQWRSYENQEMEPPSLREGRATIVLQKDPTGWVAIHTHFSLNPGSTPVL